MSKRNIFVSTILVLLAAIMVIVPVLVMAQDAAEEEELPDCPAFEGEATDVRIGYYMGEAIAFTQSGQRRSAEFSYTCIIEVVDPSYLPAYIGRVNIYTANRQYEEAMEDLTTITELDPSSPVAYNNRGIIQALLGEYELAAADFDQAISLDGGFVPSLNNRAILHMIAEEYDDAAAIFEQIIANSNLNAALTIIRDPENDAELPEFTSAEALSFAMLAQIDSIEALTHYNDYLTVTQGRADSRIQSAAGALESRLTFDLRLDDGSFFISARFGDDE